MEEMYKQNVKELQEQLQKANIRIAELREELDNLKLLLKMMRGV
tara:strand:+ start:2699 stop:2830 length:132 start_codon:yes stop_codon:yes gene_type:complete